MQDNSNPVAQWLHRLTIDLGGALQASPGGRTLPYRMDRDAPALTAALLIALTLPAGTVLRPGAAPIAANDNQRRAR